MMDERDLGETQILAAFIGISEMIGNLPDLSEILKTVVRIAPQLVKVDRCAILLINDGTQELQTLEVFCFEPAFATPFTDLRIKLSDVPKLVNKVLKQKIPAVIRDVPQDDTFPESLVRDLAIRSMLATPIVAKGEVCGIMTLDHTQGRHYFTSKEINVVMGIADQLGLALENARILRDMADLQERYDATLEGLSDGLVTLDGDFILRGINGKAHELIALPPGVVGKPWREAFTLLEEGRGVVGEEGLMALLPAARGRLSEPRRIQLAVKGGRRIPCQLRVIAHYQRNRISEFTLVLRKLPIPKGLPTPQGGEEGSALDEALQRF